MSLLLLLETRTGVLTQLELVQVYCDGSGAKTQLEQILLALAESNHAVSTNTLFDHTGSGGSGRVFGFSVQPETKSFDGNFNPR